MNRLHPGIDASKFLVDQLGAPSRDGAQAIIDSQLRTTVTATSAASIQRQLNAIERSGAWQIAIVMRVFDADRSFGREFQWNESVTSSERRLQFRPVVGAKATRNQVERFTKTARLSTRTNRFVRRNTANKGRRDST